MIREPKEVDFITTGRTLGEEEFTHISQLIAARKALLHKKAGKNVGVARKRILRADKVQKAGG